MKLKQIIVLVLFGILSNILLSQEQGNELYIKYKIIEQFMMPNDNAYDYYRWDIFFEEVFVHKAKLIGRKFKGAILDGDSIYHYHIHDYKNNTLEGEFGLLSNSCISKEILLQEKLELFSWEIHPEIKEILSFKCNKATCYFRGREYVAWFTREIPYKAGPWKFHGLPGVILEVKSLDNIFKWKAETIKIREQRKEMSIPVEHYRIITLAEYLDLLKAHELKSFEMEKVNKIKYKDNPKYYHTIYIPQINRIEQFDLGLDFAKEARERLKKLNIKVPNE